MAAVALCAVACLLLPATASAEFGPGGPPGSGGPSDPLTVPDECTFEEGEPGRYIVVLRAWVEDPEAIAREHVEIYGGNLGFIYTSALKGYSAEFLPRWAQALQAEPTVKYVSVDELIWMDDSSGVIQWRSCPLAPPLGPAPPAVERPEPPEPTEPPKHPQEPGPPEASDDTGSFSQSPSSIADMPAPSGSATQPGASGSQGATKPRVTHCRKGKVRKGKRCVRRQGGPSRVARRGVIISDPR